MSAAGDAIRLTRLQLRRAPGFEQGGFTLDGLDAGVNVVFGPNGSGKTTTAAAIEAALWPLAGRASRASLAARFTFANAGWNVDVDAGQVRVQRDGHDAAPPAPPRNDLRHRYRLHLHELLMLEHRGHDFAAEIARESAGGHDVPGAAARLEMVAPTPRATAQTRELAEARQQLNRVREMEGALARKVERLAELESRLEGARSARARLALLDAAMAHARLRQAHDVAAAALAAYDPRAASLAGDEAARLDELSVRAVDAASRAADGKRRREEAAARQRRELPAGAIPDTLVPTLRSELASLQELRQLVTSAEAVLASAAAACEEARRTLGDGVDADRAAAADLSALGDLGRWAEEAGRLRAERLLLERELSTLTDDAPAHDPDTLARGIRSLEEWLAAPDAAGHGDTHTRRHTVATALPAMIGAAALAVGSSRSPASLAVAAVIGIAAVVLLVLGLRRTPAADHRAAHVEGYARLRLPQPASWERATVARLLDELRDAAADAREAARRGDRRATVERQLRELEPRRTAVERRRAELVERLGLAPDTDAASIAWVVERVGRLQDARATLAGAHETLAALRERETSMRDSMIQRLLPLSLAPDDAGHAELKGAVEALERRERSHAEAGDALRMAERDRAAAEAELARIASDRRAILERVGLGEDDVALLSQWTESLPVLRAARERASNAAAQLAAARGTLERMPGFVESLLDVAEAELEAGRADAERAAAELESLAGESGTIRAEVEKARAGHEVEAALAAVRAAEGALRDSCERDARAAVGAALVDWVQEVTRDQQRPPVFHRARDLFSRVTHGRWLLELEDGDEPSFRAVDTDTGTGHALGELSSGTRVQLLLAVRLAFVETQEREQGGARLPLLLDETLGTCDDARARAVVETVLELARDGRQVVYFTAQWDEVEKWRALDGTYGVRVAIHSLDDAHAAEARRLAPAVTEVAPRAALPARADMTHEEYGRALGVPGVSLAAASVGGTHLWHLVEDLPLLHHLLRSGVSTWGALEALVEHGGAALLAGHPDAYPRIRAAARALEAAHAWARVGHGRPVDRRALAESGAVSDTFMERVHAACEECDGDAARLVELLEEGRVKGFQQRARERLREHLVANGYLPDEAPLEPEDIAARTLGAVATEFDAGLVSRGQLDRIIASVLPHGVAGGELPVAHPGLGRAHAHAQARADGAHAD